MSNSDMPAMPQAVTYGPDGGVIASYDFAGGQGLSKREYFAGLAMQGFLATGEYCASQDLMREAVSAADCLLWQLEQEQSQ